ncbi:mantle protein-like [Sabethes cyaneus]|uniref:mantle protein-like n=1 Tax=Sabethes cyaneus TaxID=53552 RepID=UPI00237EA6C2|nr:mantle protein-like [Sabethes cyaneus]
MNSYKSINRAIQKYHSFAVISPVQSAFINYLIAIFVNLAQAFVVLSMAVALVSCAAVDDSNKKEKRGLWELSDDHSDFGYDSHHHHDLFEDDHHHELKTITKKVPVPYPVEVEKHISVPVKVPYPVHVEKKVPVVVEKKFPVYVEKKVPVHVDRPVPYPVEVKVPVIQQEYVEVPKPYAVHVEKPVPVYVQKPVYVEKPVPVTVHIKEHKKHWGLF